MFFAILNWTSLVNSLICCWSETLGTADDEEEDALEEEDEDAEEEETDVAVGDEKEEVELGRIDEEGSSIFIPSSELAHEVEVETLKEDDDLLFLVVEEGLMVTFA